jgi:hypothetical protein
MKTEYNEKIIFSLTLATLQDLVTTCGYLVAIGTFLLSPDVLLGIAGIE